MKKVKPLNNQKFIKKVVINLAIATSLLIVSLAIGIVGYHYLLNVSWLDALVNASMILTGMGPVDRASTSAAKIFTSFYAIYSGVAFLTSIAFMASPIFHRVLHKFHLDLEDDNN